MIQPVDHLNGTPHGKMNRYIKLEIFCRAGFDLDKQGFEQRHSDKLYINCIYAKSSVHKNQNQGPLGLRLLSLWESHSTAVWGLRVLGILTKGETKG